MSLVALSGCASWADLGTPIDRVEPHRGYRVAAAVAPHAGDDMLVVASFSGGGTRAAAMAHGVLLQLAATRLGGAATPPRLLDELDVVSGVSGGAVTAAFLALDRTRYFERFESSFLHRNVSRDMWRALLNPITLVRLMSRRYGRGDLYAEELDRRLFRGATFGDLAASADGPFAILNATDLSVGARFEFTQDRFDAICGDLSAYPVARAVAASAASPPAVSPLAMRNHAGRCGFVVPTWVGHAIADADQEPDATRRRLLAREWLAYQEAARYPYLHLADGSIADDLGIRTLTDAMLELEDRDFDRLRPGRPRRIVVIAVNAAADSGPAIAKRRAAPGELATPRRAAQVSFDRYSTESVVLLRRLLRDLAQRRSPSRPEDVYLVEVDPRLIADPVERDAVMSAPTTLALARPLVDRIVDAGSRLLAASPEFQRLLRDTGSVSP